MFVLECLFQYNIRDFVTMIPFIKKDRNIIPLQNFIGQSIINFSNNGERGELKINISGAQRSAVRFKLGAQISHDNGAFSWNDVKNYYD